MKGYEIDVFDAFEEAVNFAHAIGCPVYGEPLTNRAVYDSSDRSYAGDLLPATTLINLSPLQFLDETCFKAGMTSRCWEEPGTRVYRFMGKVFS